MNAQAKGKLIIIVAPSGTGKSTLLKRIRADFPELEESISYTTRSPRENEQDGRDYFFITRQQFDKMIKNDEFIEWAIVHDEMKGTSRSYISRSMKKGKNLILDLDVQGTDSFKRVFPSESCAIFIEPPSLQELEQRLRGRATESEQELAIRLENARSELDRKDDYDYKVLNEDVELAYNRLKDLIEKILRG